VQSDKGHSAETEGAYIKERCILAIGIKAKRRKTRATSWFSNQQPTCLYYVAHGHICILFHIYYKNYTLV
jgi:hypothetical protein